MQVGPAIRLGPLSLEHPFLLAPMAGITHSSFRRLMRRHGSSMVISELVSANGIDYGSARTLQLLDFHQEERPVGLQIFGEDREGLVSACRVVQDKGADFVDLNLGCPVPKVVKKGGGAAMCRDVPALFETLSAMVKAVKIPVSIKIRTGWDSGSRNALEVVRAAADAGIAWVAIHGRTRAQGYSGDADWEFIGNVKAKSSLPVIGNGDIVSAERAISHLRLYGVDGVMIGRGALRNPFIFEQAIVQWGRQHCASTPYAGDSSGALKKSGDYVSLISELRELLEAAYPGRGSSIHARKFLSWFSAGFPGSHEFRKKVFSDLKDDLVWTGAIEFFSSTTHRHDPTSVEGGFLMGGHG